MLIIAAVMAVGIIVPLVNQRRNRTTAAPAETSLQARRWRLDGATAFNLGLVALFATALWLSRRFDVRAGLFPWTITAAALILAIVHAVSELTSRRRIPGASEDARAPDVPRRHRDGRPALHLVEFRVVAPRADRAGQGGMEDRPLRTGAGGDGVHSAAGVTLRSDIA